MADSYNLMEEKVELGREIMQSDVIVEQKFNMLIEERERTMPNFL
jgi:hypothetical protein